MIGIKIYIGIIALVLLSLGKLLYDSKNEELVNIQCDSELEHDQIRALLHVDTNEEANKKLSRIIGITFSVIFTLLSIGCLIVIVLL